MTRLLPRPLHLRPGPRPTLPGLLLVLTCAVTFTTPAVAEEPAEPSRPPAKRAVDGTGANRAEDANRLERIGRQLLSPDAAVREQARHELLDLLAASDEPGHVLARAMRSTRTWADASERLIERWIAVALGGADQGDDAKARRQAVRFLHAAGPEAILRLVNAQRDRLLGVPVSAPSAPMGTREVAKNEVAEGDVAEGDKRPAATRTGPNTGAPDASRPQDARAQPGHTRSARHGPAWTSGEERAPASPADPAGEPPAEAEPQADPASVPPRAGEPPAPAPSTQAPAPAQQAAEPKSMQAYDISFLHRARVKESRVRVFLAREADTQQVSLAGGKAIVIASEAGHQGLRTALEAWRQRLRAAWALQVTAKAPAPASSAAAPPSDPDDEAARETEAVPANDARGPAAPRSGRSSPSPAAEAPPTPQTAEDEQRKAEEATAAAVQKAALPAPGTAVRAGAADGPRWRISPLIVRVPKRPDSGVVEPQRRLNGKPAAGVVAPLFPNADAGVYTLVGTLEDAQRWSKLAEVLADAETHRPGAVKVLAARTGSQFIGRRRNYRRDVERKKDGGYAVVEGVILEGLHLGFRIQQAPEGRILLETQARRIEAKGPWQTRQIRVKGSTQTLELDLPEKNVARGTATATLPAAGGGVAILFRDLERAKEHYVVLVLTIKRLP